MVTGEIMKQVCLDDRRFVEVVVDVGDRVPGEGKWRNFQRTRTRNQRRFSRVMRAPFDWVGD
jgi:hypothetical protein